MSKPKRCPFCGRAVTWEDASSTVRHELPPCADFERIMRAAGLRAVEVRLQLEPKGPPN